jgi:hypothetical protein
MRICEPSAVSRTMMFSNSSAVTTGPALTVK